MRISLQQLPWYLAFALLIILLFVSALLWFQAPNLTKQEQPAAMTVVPAELAGEATATSAPASAESAVSAAPTHTSTATVQPTATQPTATPTVTPTPSQTPTLLPTPTLSAPITFAVIGDFGTNSSAANKVADIIEAENMAFVVTVGDNRYGERTFDEAVGGPYCAYLANVPSGPYCDGGDRTTNAFFPSLGNHDYSDGLGVAEYLDYFDLPGEGIETTNTSGTERYYDIIQWPIHFFFLDSEGGWTDAEERATQKAWLEEAIKLSTTPWQIVILHDPPFSSSPNYGSATDFQWPFVEWGVEAVLAGHHHTYERILQDGIVYLVNGLGGADIYELGPSIPGSQIQYNEKAGAILVTTDNRDMHFRFVTEDNEEIDTYAISLYAEPAPTPSLPAAATLEVSIVHGVDDGEEVAEDGEVSLDSSDLELGRDDDSGVGAQLVGLRFRNLAIPAGAIIDRAYLIFRNMRVSAEPSTVVFRAEAADDASPFVEEDYNLSRRVLTETAVSWSVPVWQEQYEFAQSPDVTALVQEIVRRPGWQVGNSMAFIVNGDVERAVVAADGRTTRSAVLHVEYRVEESGQ